MTFLTRMTRWAILVVVTLVLAGCGGGGDMPGKAGTRDRPVKPGEPEPGIKTKLNQIKNK